jgi:hypothetical protein
MGEADIFEILARDIVHEMVALRPAGIGEVLEKAEHAGNPDPGSVEMFVFQLLSAGLVGGNAKAVSDGYLVRELQDPIAFLETSDHPMLLLDSLAQFDQVFLAVSFNVQGGG